MSSKDFLMRQRSRRRCYLVAHTRRLLPSNNSRLVAICMELFDLQKYKIPHNATVRNALQSTWIKCHDP